MMTIFIKTYRDHWKALVAWALTLIGLVTLEMAIYPTLAKNGAAFQQFIDAYPDAIKKIFRMQDYISGPGFLSTELYSMMIPLVLIAVGATWGASATAQEEDKGTADILFTLPLARWKIVVAKMAAALSALILLAFLAMANIVLLRGAVDMTIDSSALVAGTLSSIGIGLVFSSLAFFVGSLTSHKGIALGAATGVSLIFFVLYSVAGLVDSIDWSQPFNPMNWGLGSSPLFNGVDTVGLMKLFSLSLVLLLSTLMIFERKDIHSQ